ncbi:MAG: phenylalanine--tRNA ligase subunit alpha [Nitrospirota bacterium]|jgi:phenylalanyl-tRNA synthetase alpha chain
MPSLEELRESFKADLEGAATTAEFEQMRVKYLGRKGLLTEQMKQIGSLPPEERKAFGQAVNELKGFISGEITARAASLREEELRGRLATESIDVTLPGRHVPYGSEHPISRTLNEIIDIFTRMGFGVEEGPEVELDYYNFEALNMPKDHPARDMQDTFYITGDSVLRTHTSPVQVRVMEKRKPPLRFIAPGKVYRCDADISHTPMFHQVEGLMVDADISFSHLKGVLEAFLHEMFGPRVPVRFRPSFFPFTEPSAEVDIGCTFCRDETGVCRVCKDSEWIEILGAGMVHPRVFEMAGCDPERYSGFAFGMGVERIAMLKYSIDDIRLFFENDLRFLRQF